MGGDLAGSGEVLRAEDGAEVGDQGFPGGARQSPSGADFQPFDLRCPDWLIGPHPQDQGGDSGAYSGGGGARAAFVDDGAAGGKDGRVVDVAHDFYVVDMGDVAKVGSPEQIRARSSSCAQAVLISSTVLAGDSSGMLPKPK